MSARIVRVLVVDDQFPVAEIIREEVASRGIECLTCADATEARSLLKQRPFDVVVTDISLPDLSGMDLLARLRQTDPRCKVILITGNSTRDYLGQALMLGAFDYVEKPFDPAEVADLILRAARSEGEIAPLPARAAESLAPGVLTRQAGVDTVQALVRAVEAKDPYTRRHSEQVAYYAECLAEAMDLPALERESVRVASLLHDVGKIGVPDRILTKPGRLTSEEFEQIRRHPPLGESILSKVTMFRGEAKLVRHHHERWDGGGYPDGLAGEQIPPLSRLICIADCLDAMLMARAYKDPYPVDRTLEELRIGAGRQFDPVIATTTAQWIQTHPHDLILPAATIAAATA